MRFAANQGDLRHHEKPMSVVVHVPLPDDLKSVIDRRVAEGGAASDAEFLSLAARFYAEELDVEDRSEDDDLTAVALAGIGDAEAGRFTLIATEADAEAVRGRIMAAVRAGLAETP
jgi:hypothetical protein